MTVSGPKTFRALLERDGTSLRWTIARLPFDIAKAWPVRRGRRVRGEINGCAFRTSLFPDSGGTGHILLVNKKIQTAARISPGDRVQIRLEPDLEEREAVVPDELARALRAERGLREWFDGLSPSLRRDIGKYASEPASPATRRTRALQTAEWLLLAMEGERETPPILRVAFQRQPRAEAGWNAMTPAQRRRHLLGIFHYRTVEARERRAAAAIEDAVRIANRKAPRPPRECKDL